MSRDPSSRRDPNDHVRRVAAGMLILGWAIAVAVYVSAPPVVEDPDAYELTHSRKYLREVERIGGKAALLTGELNAFVESLWEGRNRAYTIAGLTVAVAGAYVLIARGAAE